MARLAGGRIQIYFEHEVRVPVPLHTKSRPCAPDVAGAGKTCGPKENMPPDENARL